MEANSHEGRETSEAHIKNTPANNRPDSNHWSQAGEMETMSPDNHETPSELNKEEIFELNEETLKIIGEEPPSQKELEIHSSLELSTLNANILKKDKYFTFTQNLTGPALSALAPIITDLISMRTIESRKMLENLWDGAQLLAEIHHSQTIARRACILPSVSKQMAEQLTKRRADKYLFGKNLGERIKEIKLINRLGQDIKIQPAKTISTVPNPSNWKSPLVSQKSATQSGYKQRPHQSRKLTATESSRKSSYPRSSYYRD
ncbi:reverse transcriptase and recombinase [Lasius niger]|uniref:Reverse transcriptase and recombinase n=1 Tax=Lasius niger TaxID=67767 RepID=A0A0J7KMD1_LASNI|nr:reverse transcriptase and recombinase [Lasius niger]